MINLPTLKYLLLISSFLLINKNSVIAQITPDNTLGAESSRVVPNGAIDKIDGGALRDKNLFHSFKEFNIKNGQSVYFNNPSGIENILTRVTGKNPSNILGTLGVDGAANLFLINPNGIVFGENAKLDLGGSFVGTTASGLEFGEQGNFSATNPQAPGLLTVNPNALFFNQLQGNAGIINKSQASAGISPDGIETTGLRVPDGKSLLLVGGDITLDDGGLRAYEGNIELASVASLGNIGLDISGNTFSLNIPTDVERGDISLANESYISVFGAGEGNLVINARNLEISNSFIYAGIGVNSDNPNAQAGNINLNATESISLKDGAVIDNGVYSQGNAGDIFLKASNSISLVNSNIYNNIEAGGIGNGGNINITAGSLSLTDGSQIQAILNSVDAENNLAGGQVNAGDININVSDAITISGIKNGFSSSIFSLVNTGAVGNAGDININTGSLSLAEGSEINSKTLGQGSAGNITINARQTIYLDGSGEVTLADGSSGTIFTRIINSVDPDAVGNAGNIQLNTGTLSATNGAFISSGTVGKGNAGNIAINASDTVSFDTNSYASSEVFSNSVAKAGDIRVKTGNLSLTNGSQLSTKFLGSGNAGNIFVEARDSVTLDGVNGNAISGIQSNLLTNAVGKGGDIQIVTGLLSVTNGADISAATDGKGDAGNITINARDKVTINGFDTSSGLLSNISAIGGSNSVGNGGEISISTDELLLKNSGSILTSNFGTGNAGNIFLDVRDSITFDGKIVGDKFPVPSNVSTSVKNGDAGNIQINTGSLFLTDGSLINAVGFSEESSNEIANAGNILINANDSIKIDGENSGLATFLLRGKGKGGDIQITTGSLSVTNGSSLSTTTNGQGNAGNIRINANDNVTFDQKSSALAFVYENAIGDGGDIKITAGSLSFNNDSFLTTSTFGKGDAGNVIINSNTFEAVNGGRINTQTSTSGNAGNINLNIKDKITLSGTGKTRRSGLFAETSAESTGKGGSIFIDPRLVIIENGAGVSVASGGAGDAGDISLQADNLQLNNGFIAAITNSTQGGNINLQLGELLLLRNNSLVSTTAGLAQAGGNGGNITINSPFIVALPKENSDITADASSGNGGNVDIKSQGIFGITPRSQLTPQSDITASSETGIQGTINITNPELDPNQGVIELPEGLVDKSNQIAQICPQGVNARRLSEFYITGKGSLPPSPFKPLTGYINRTSLATLDEDTSRQEDKVIRSDRKINSQSKEIVEAQGFMKNADGEIYLVAQVTSSISSSNYIESGASQLCRKPTG